MRRARFGGSGARATVLVAGLANHTSYHWQARTVDRTGRASAWVAYGSGSTDFRINYAQAPSLPANMAQLKTDSVTAIPVGAVTDQASVLFRALVVADSGQQVRLEVEVRTVGSAFVDTATVSSTPVPQGSVATVPSLVLADNVAYHWQARAVDQTGRASAWTSFGGNAESVADFSVALTPTQLAILTQPGGSTTDNPIAPAVRVAAQDAAGNTLASFTGTVTAALASNPAGGALSGTTSVAAVAGVATFSNLLIRKVGSGYTLQLTSGALAATTVAFAVSQGGASAATSVVTVSSGTVASGSGVTLTLQAKDSSGNNLTGGGSTVAFTASGGTSTGTISSTVDNGNGTYQATFTGVLAGTATTIHATIGGVTVTTPPPTVTVTPGPASATTSTVARLERDGGVGRHGDVDATGQGRGGEQPHGGRPDGRLHRQRRDEHGEHRRDDGQPERQVHRDVHGADGGHGDDDPRDDRRCGGHQPRFRPSR